MRRGLREERRNSLWIGGDMVPLGEEIDALQCEVQYLWEQDDEELVKNSLERLGSGYVDAGATRLEDFRAELNNMQAQLNNLKNHIEEEAYRDYESLDDIEELTVRYNCS